MRIALLILGAAAFAQSVPEPKVVPIAMTNEFYWADGEAVRAQEAASAAMRVRNEAVSAMMQFCGADTDVQHDPKDLKRLICVVKAAGK